MKKSSWLTLTWKFPATRCTSSQPSMWQPSLSFKACDSAWGSCTAVCTATMSQLHVHMTDTCGSR